jgi:uncharacterized protein (TIGR03435 family)
MTIARSALIAMCLSALAPGQEFEVATVRLNQTGSPPYSNFPLGPGDVYVPNGGHFLATGFPLITYVAFAYKIIGNQAQYLLPQFPEWAKSDHYDIEARAEGNPGKDQMRALMRGLLAERFALKIHTENREVPVLGFALDKPGKTGPQLWLHPQSDNCPTEVAPTVKGPVPTDDRGVPTLCNGIFPLPGAPGRTKLGARNVTLQFLADSLSAGANLGRPMVDQTGLPGRVDFILDFVPDRLSQPQPGTVDAPEISGPTLQQALREQLGIRLQSAKTTIEVLVLDHVERPSSN